MSNFINQYYFWNNVFKSVTTQSIEDATGLTIYKVNDVDLKRTFKLIKMENKTYRFTSGASMKKLFCKNSLENLKALKKYNKLEFDTYLISSNLQNSTFEICNLEKDFQLFTLNTLKKFNKAFKHFNSFYILTCSNKKKVLVAQLPVEEIIYETIYCIIDVFEPLETNDVTTKKYEEKRKNLHYLLTFKEIFYKHKFSISIMLSLILFLIGIITNNIIFIILDMLILATLPES